MFPNIGLIVIRGSTGIMEAKNAVDSSGRGMDITTFPFPSPQ
jgi:hypothetical protein